MTPITFKRYRVNGIEPTIIAERITYWYLINYNGEYGTCLVLDTGAEINVGEWPQDVDRKFRAAIAELDERQKGGA